MIESKDNPQIKLLNKLLTQRKARREAKAFVLENTRFISDLADQAPHYIQKVFICNAAPSFIDRMEKKHIELIDVAPPAFKHSHSLKSAPEAVAIISQPSATLESLRHCETLLFLSEISNPKNLGAIMRNAAAFSVDGIVLSPNCVDPFHPEAIRAAAGHFHQVPLATASLSDLISRLDQAQFYVLDPKGKTSLSQLEKEGQQIFIFGPEPGIPSSVLTDLESRMNSVRIGLDDQVESLNVSVSSGILLHHLYQSPD